MIEIRTGVLKTIKQCPLCEKRIKECNCEEADYFDSKNDE